MDASNPDFLTSIDGDTFVTFEPYLRAMRFTLRALLIVGTVLAAPFAAQGAAAGQVPGFAVVELFTSEGCSSCPPADEALLHISQAAAKTQFPLYVLEWHVDYWDYLGWKDPFGSPQASLRQRTYAQVLGTDVYTPEAIVNGSVIPDWAGDEGEVGSIVRKLAAVRPPAGVSLSLSAEAAGGTVRVHADVSGAPLGSVLLVALVEGGLSSTPGAGENAGRKLTHSSVVLSAVTRSAGGGDIPLYLPSGADISQSSVVALLQDKATMKIILAARAAILADGRVSGRVVDSSGKGIAETLIQVCSDRLCVPATTGAEGFFTLEKLPAGSYTVSLNDGAPVARFLLAKGQSLQLGQIRR